MSMANLAMAQAMALQQEQQQNEQFARQNAAGQFGTDHLGNAVTRSQRQAWNDRVSRFRQQRGPATGSQVFDAIQEGGGQQYAGENVNQGQDGMAPGNWADPNGTGWGSMIGRGIQGVDAYATNAVNKGVNAFGQLRNGMGLGRGQGYSLSPNNTDASQGYVPGSYNGYDIANRDGLNAGFTGRGDRGDDRGDGFGGGFGDAPGHGNSRF